jgi:hypothetical protein
MIPDVIVNAPLTDNGTFNVTPEALVLFILNPVRFAVGDVPRFAKVPLPPMVCVIVTGEKFKVVLVLEDVKLKVKLLDEIKVPLVSTNKLPPRTEEPTFKTPPLLTVKLPFMGRL